MVRATIPKQGNIMDTKPSLSLAELKVGIFVLVTLALLGIAIFTVGTQVGLFEDTFFAKTYLNNVSGLKPGDIVLLAGVEVGNVISVQISKSGELPSTQTNLALFSQIEDFTQQLKQLQLGITSNEKKFISLTSQYSEKSNQSSSLQRQLNNLETLLQRQKNRFQELEQSIKLARSNLQTIEVFMEIQSQHRDWIKEDSDISLGSIGLLGDKYIEISLGRGNELPPVVQDQIDALIGTQTQEVVVITGTTQPGFEELITGADDVLTNVEFLSNKLGDVLNRLSEGEGTVGKFMTDTSFYDNLNQTVIGAKKTVKNTSILLQNIQEGQGTMGRLIQSQEIYDKINLASNRLEKVLTQIEQAEGTLGKLIKDPFLYDTSKQVATNIENITGRMNSGEGTLGKLSVDDQLYFKLSSSLDKFFNLVETLEQGQGTLGKLAKDEKLYENMNQISSEMVKLLYDFRQDPKKFLTVKFELF